MNNITFIGRLTADPVITESKKGTKIAQFVVAVQKEKNEADYFRCVAWDKQAEVMEKYGYKGGQVGCSGSLHTRQYENNKGQKVNTWEIILHTIDLLSFKDNNKKVKEDVDEEVAPPFDTED